MQWGREDDENEYVINGTLSWSTISGQTTFWEQTSTLTETRTELRVANHLNLYIL